MKPIQETESMHDDEDEKSADGFSYTSNSEDAHLLDVTPGLGVTTRKKNKRRGAQELFMSFGTFNRFRNHEPSVRSQNRHRLNVVFGILLILCLISFLVIGGLVYYRRVVVPAQKAKALDDAIKAHALAAKQRVEMCRGIDWEEACDALGDAGARRRKLDEDQSPSSGLYDDFEELLLDSDDPSVTYDQFCLRVYRLQMFGNITFPYHSSQLLKSGGNQSMALFIQHGAMRNAEEYFCSFKKLMLEQKYRSFDDILVIAPDFNYEHDELVHPVRLLSHFAPNELAVPSLTHISLLRTSKNDAFWNSTKPWGDWRVGAESDPDCCGKTGKTVSSFDVLDHMVRTSLLDANVSLQHDSISHFHSFISPTAGNVDEQEAFPQHGEDQLLGTLRWWTNGSTLRSNEYFGCFMGFRRRGRCRVYHRQSFLVYILGQSTMEV